MRFSFTAKNTTVSDQVKQRATQKIGKLEKLLPDNTEVFVTFSTIKLDNRVEVTIPLNKRILRAEVTENDMLSAIDSVVDVLEKQIVKYKNRLRDKARRDHSFKDEFTAVFVEEPGAEEHSFAIEKTKRFALKPMDAEEAVMEMELSGHGFYVFRNGQTDEVNVVYKRKNGTYGLIEPEY